MALTSVVAALVLIALALAAVGYFRREPRVAGRSGLFALRGASLLLLLALLVNPPLPGTDDGGFDREPVHWVLVDAGRALDVPAEEGGTLRERVVERATEAERGGARLALAGPEPEGVDAATLAATGPRGTVRDPGPSLLRLAEAGADSISVLSPFRTTRDVLERAIELPLPVRLERVGGPVRNAGILELQLPDRPRAGEPLEGTVTLFGEGGAPGDSVRIEIEAGWASPEPLAAQLPAAGSRERIPFELAPPPDTGRIRVGARVRLEGDAFGPDDERVRRVRVGPPEGGIMVISLEPDWEPRTLLPVLEAVTGLEGEGYLRAGEDRWLPVGDGADPASPVPASTFRERIPSAGLLVLHGWSGGSLAWVREAAANHPRILHLPTTADGVRLAGVGSAPPAGGEWDVDAELPASPAAPYLSGIDLAGLPALTGLAEVGGGTQVLRARPREGGGPLSALVLDETDEGRRAVAAASGFWRWGSRSGAPREAYRGLWAGVASWLLAPDAVAGVGRVRPVESVVPEGTPFRWIATGGAGDTLVVDFERSPGDAGDAAGGTPAGSGAEGPERRTVVLDEEGRGATDPLPRGSWSWDARTIGGGEPDAPGEADVPAGTAGSGVVEVEGWSDALVVPPLDPLPEARGADARAEGDEGPAAADAGRPLRTHPLPYLLLLGLLCGEWIARRRLGLR